jgi:hypothetical protein
VTKKLGLIVGEVALRWLKDYSKTKQECGDAIFVGASSVKQLEGNLVGLEKDGLPEGSCGGGGEGMAGGQGCCAEVLTLSRASGHALQYIRMHGRLIFGGRLDLW